MDSVEFITLLVDRYLRDWVVVIGRYLLETGAGVVYLESKLFEGEMGRVSLDGHNILMLSSRGGGGDVSRKVDLYTVDERGLEGVFREVFVEGSTWYHRTRVRFKYWVGIFERHVTHERWRGSFR